MDFIFRLHHAAFQSGHSVQVEDFECTQAAKA